MTYVSATEIASGITGTATSVNDSLSEITTGLSDGTKAIYCNSMTVSNTTADVGCQCAVGTSVGTCTVDGSIQGGEKYRVVFSKLSSVFMGDAVVGVGVYVNGSLAYSAAITSGQSADIARGTVALSPGDKLSIKLAKTFWGVASTPYEACVGMKCSLGPALTEHAGELVCMSSGSVVGVSHKYWIYTVPPLSNYLCDHVNVEVVRDN